MGIFDNMTKALFKEKKDGTTIYYAKGLLRKGYILKNEVQKEKLYKFHKRTFKYLLPLGIVYALLLGLAGAPIIGFIPIIAVALILHFKQKFLIKDLPIYEEKLTLKETKRTIANIFPKWFSIFIMINGALAIGLALLVPFIADDNMQNIEGIVILLLVMGLPLLGIGWYFYKNKDKVS
jgi:hypothetical protein